VKISGLDMHNYEEYLLLAMGNQQTITHYSQLTKERQEAGGRRQEAGGKRFLLIVWC